MAAKMNPLVPTLGEDPVTGGWVGAIHTPSKLKTKLYFYFPFPSFPAAFPQSRLCSRRPRGMGRVTVTMFPLGEVTANVSPAVCATPGIAGPHALFLGAGARSFPPQRCIFITIIVIIIT